MSRAPHLYRAALGVALAGTVTVVALSIGAGMGAPPALELAAWAGGMALVSGLLTLLGRENVFPEQPQWGAAANQALEAAEAWLETLDQPKGTA